MKRLKSRFWFAAALLAAGAGGGLWFAAQRKAPHHPPPPALAFPQRLRPRLTAPARALPPAPLPILPDFEARAAALHRPAVRELPGVPPAEQLLLAHGAETTARPPHAHAPEARFLSQNRTFPVIIQARGPITAPVRTALEATGAKLLEYIPHFAFLAEATPGQLAALQALPHVRATRSIAPADKLSRFLSHLPGDPDAGAYAVPAVVSALSPADARAIAAQARQLGAGSIRLAPPEAALASFRADLPVTALKTLAAQGGVLHIDEALPARTCNDVARSAAFLNTAAPAPAFGLTGQGQFIGHMDSGLDTGSPATLHPDFTNALHAAFTVPNSGLKGNWADNSGGHGTHTAGSILGDGSASGGLYRGAAPGAGLIHQCARGSTANSIIVLDDLAPIFAQTYQAGARIHSDSWGMSTYGDYTYIEASIDRFVWAHPDFLPVVAAGNDGSDSDKDGIVDPISTTSPANAKNLLAVGAAESHRPAGSGGYTARANAIWGRFTAEPISSDLISTPASGRYGIAAFSGRGPTLDGRIKPDIIAPGTDIISTRAPGAEGWGTLPANARYMFSGGTSMATPLAAGLAALVREDLQKNRAIPEPTAALLRALIVNGAQTLAPGQYGTGAAREIPETSPNAVEGFGLPRLDAILYPPGSTLTLHDRLTFQTGERRTFPIRVTAPGQPLTATLVWTDAPASLYAARMLVNDLDLSIICPDGTTLSAADALNTTERIRIPSAAPGTYRICIEAPHIPIPGGPAALAVAAATQTAGAIIHHPPAALPVNQPHTFTAATHNTAATPSFICSANGAAWQTLPCAPEGGAFTVTFTPTAEGTLRYAFTAGTVTNGPHSVVTGPAITLTIATDPATGIAAPRAGRHTAVKGAPLTLTAYPSRTFTDNLSKTWTSTATLTPAAYTTGGVKTTLPAGQTSITLTPEADTTLTWHYTAANTGADLLYTEYLASGSYLFLRAYHPPNATAATANAFDFITLDDTPHAFSGRTLGNTAARWPSLTGPSPLQTTFTITAETTLYDRYLPAFDETGGLFNFWKARHFGAETPDPEEDLDADGFTNLMESLDNTDPRDPDNLPAPPRILFTPVTLQTTHPPWLIEAAAQDNFAIATLNLIWREAGSPAWQTNDLLLTGSTLLDPPSKGRIPVEYRIETADVLGAAGYTPHIVGTPPHTLLNATAAPLATLTPGHWPTPLATGSAETPTLTATLASAAGYTPLHWSATLAGIPQTVTNAPPVDPIPTGDWHLSTRRTATPSWFCGKETGNASANTTSTLTFTRIALPETAATLTLSHWFSLEGYGNGYSYDYALLEIRPAGQTAWEPFTPLGGYPELSYPDATPCFSRQIQTWQTHTFDLSTRAGTAIDLRFRMETDGSTSFEGWHLALIGIAQTDYPPHTPHPAFLPPAPAAGTLAAPQSQTIALAIDPAALAYGQTRSLALRVATNDPLRPALYLPFTVQRGSRITATAENGRITPAAAFLFPPRESIDLTLTPDPWHTLAEITPPPFTPSGETLSVSSQTDTAIHARFTPRTTPQGIPLFWLAAHYGETLTPEALTALAALDTDSDGLLTADEYLIGTDPTDPLSRLAIDRLDPTPEGWSLRLVSGDKATLRLEYKPTLATETWQVLETLHPPTAPTNTFIAPLHPSGFFRLRAEP